MWNSTRGWRSTRTGGSASTASAGAPLVTVTVSVVVTRASTETSVLVLATTVVWASTLAAARAAMNERRARADRRRAMRAKTYGHGDDSKGRTPSSTPCRSPSGFVKAVGCARDGLQTRTAHAQAAHPARPDRVHRPRPEGRGRVARGGLRPAGGAGVRGPSADDPELRRGSLLSRRGRRQRAALRCA